MDEKIMKRAYTCEVYFKVPAGTSTEAANRTADTLLGIELFDYFNNIEPFDAVTCGLADDAIELPAEETKDICFHCNAFHVPYDSDQCFAVKEDDDATD